MRIRKHSRVVALVLALVMILPLISIPTFAEDTVAPFNFSQNFDSAKEPSEAIVEAKPNVSLENGAIRRDYKAYNDGTYYIADISGKAAKSAITVAEGGISGDRITKATWVDGNVTYNVTGKINPDSALGSKNSTKATVTNAETGAAHSNTNLAIFTVQNADATYGKVNIGTPMNLKVPAVNVADYDNLQIEADYFFSEDLSYGAAVEITWQSTKGRVDIAKLSIGTDCVTVNLHGDAGKAYGTGIRVPKNIWVTLKAVLDLKTGDISLFVDGEFTGYVKGEKQLAAKATLKENSLNLGQYSRGGNKLGDMKGYFLVDNASVTTENINTAVYGVTDMDHFATVTAKQLRYYDAASNSVKTGNFISNFATSSIPTQFGFVTDETGNTVGRVNYTAAAWEQPDYYGAKNGNNDADGDGIVDVYAYIDSSNRWSRNAEIKSYDFDTHVLTLTDDTTINVTAQEDASLIAKGCYGTFTDGDKTWTLSKPDYAIGNTLASQNIDKNPMFRVPYIPDTTNEVYFSIDYYIAPDSSGSCQIQFQNVYRKSTTTSTAATSGWTEFAYVDLATGKLTAYNLIESTGKGETKSIGTVPVGTWFTLSFTIDRTTGLSTFYVDGVKCATTTNFGKEIRFSKTATDFASSGLNLAKTQKSGETAKAKGYIEFDNFTVAAVSEKPHDYFVNQNFNSTALLNKAPSDTFFELKVADTIVSNECGSQAWKISYERPAGENKYNVDKNNQIKHPAFDYETTESIVFETDYFIEADAVGKLQSQFYEGVDTEQGENGFVDLYCLEFYENSGFGVLTREARHKYGSAKFKLGVWNTISVILNLKTGELEYYINGEHVFDGNLNATGEFTNISVPANQWTLGKVNKVNGQGTFYIDNVKMYAGDTIETKKQPKKDVHDFEEFNYSVGKTVAYSGFSRAPSLTTFAKQADGNMALRIDMGAAHGHDEYALYRKGEDTIYSWNVTYDEAAGTATCEKGTFKVSNDASQNYPYVVVTEKNDEDEDVKQVCYLVPADQAEAAACGPNVGAGTKIPHAELSYKGGKVVVLKADYFIEAGSTGVVESQVETYFYDVVDGEETKTNTGNFLQLFHIYLESGAVSGQGGKNYGYKLEIGKWNTITIAADLETGIFNIYANDVLARTYDCGHKNISFGTDKNSTWSFVKVQRHTNPGAGPYTGAILVDNVSINVETFAHSESYGDKFLTDEAFTSFTEGLIEGVNAASIRFKAPAGLRFGSIVNTEKVEFLKNLYGADKTKMGTIITPADYVTDEYAELDSLPGITREDLDGIEAGNSEGVRYLDIEFDGAYFQGDTAVNLEEGADYMVGSIVGLLTSNYERKFAGMGYIEFETENGVIGFYTDMTLRSVYAVADECSVSGAELTEDQIIILESYLTGDELPEEYMPPEVEE